MKWYLGKFMDSARGKQCNCIPNGNVIAREIEAIASSTFYKKDLDYILGMLFALQETRLVDTLTEFEQIRSIASITSQEEYDKNKARAREVAFGAAKKIKANSC